MLQLELNNREEEMLSDVLRSFLSELRTEVSHTDRQEYRLRLRDEEMSIKQILRRLQQSAAAEAAARRDELAMTLV